MSATPYRKDFYEKLGGSADQCESAMEREIAALEKVVSILKEFMARSEAKW